MSEVKKFEVGDYAYYVWGYGQTNVDFFKVVKRNEKSVWFEAVKAKKVYEGDMHGYAVPSDEPEFVVDGVEKVNGEWQNKFVQPKARRLIQVHQNGEEWAKEKFGHVYPWQGNKMFFSEWH